MPPTGEIVLSSVNYRDQTCSLIIQPQSKSSDAQTVINLFIACAAGIGIILIRKLIGRSLQQRNIILIEVQEIPDEGKCFCTFKSISMISSIEILTALATVLIPLDYEEVDVVAMPASTGTEVVISKQENEYQFSVKVSVAQTFVNTSETQEGKLSNSCSLIILQSLFLFDLRYATISYFIICVRIPSINLPTNQS